MPDDDARASGEQVPRHDSYRDQTRVGRLPRQFVWALLDGIPDGIVMVEADGRIVLANRRLEEMFGYERGELLGRPLETLVPDRLREAHQRHREAYRDSARVRAMGTAGQRLVGRRKDGEEFPADISLSPLREGRSRLVIAAVRDATERVAAEAALRQNETRWRFLVEDMQLGVVALDGQRRITYANPFLCQLTGHAPDEIIGRDALDVFLPRPHHDDASAGFDELLVDNVRRVYEGPIVTKCGERRYMRWRNTRVLDDAGRPAGSLSVGEDVTDAHDTKVRLEAVTEVSNAILARRPTGDVLRLVAARARALGHADVATFAMYAETPDTMVIRVADGHRADELEGTMFPTASTASGTAMATGATEEVADASRDPRTRQPIIALGDFGPSLFVPLLVAGRPFGTLALARRTGRAPCDAHDVALVEAFATQASVALEHQRLAEELDHVSPE